MTSTTTLSMPDGTRVVVPDTLDMATTYVLCEQGGWYEDELKFVGKVVKRAERAIDIGAGYGMYTLALAASVGEQGAVVAYEAAAGVATALGKTVALNRLKRVTVEACALFDLPGAAAWTGADGASETVEVTTLDACLRRHGWEEIDFVRIGTGSETARILEGGRGFFSSLSPLVQYRARMGEALASELTGQFAELGYRSYRLVPGLGVLVPFNPALPADAYLLNLFCCKGDRADALAAAGLLVRRIPAADELGELAGWRAFLGKFPYAREFSAVWEDVVGHGASGEVEEALDFYAESKNDGRPAAERWAALEASFRILRSICEREPAGMRLASLARVAREYGARAVAVDALGLLSDAIMHGNQAVLDEPFLLAGPEFELVPPGDPAGNWALASVLDGFERARAFSSFFTGEAARPVLETLRALGYLREEMEIRLGLLDARRTQGAATSVAAPAIDG